jgi:hypothetical protein
MRAAHFAMLALITLLILILLMPFHAFDSLFRCHAACLSFHYFLFVDAIDYAV